MANSRICSIPECGKTHFGKGLCQNHHYRMRKHGDPLAGRTSPGELHKFYEEIVLQYEGDECLIWPYSRNAGGYGEMHKNGDRGNVSRFVCKDANGPPPTPEHEAAHSCGKGNLGCVTKGHLSWKTPKENQADRILHDTHKRGERSHFSKITESQAREVLALKGKEPQSAIAGRFGIKQATVSDIHRGRRWGWLQPTDAA